MGLKYWVDKIIFQSGGIGNIDNFLTAANFLITAIVCLLLMQI